jgi:hypothetical protein
MTDAQRSILERVASGELDPQAATKLLDDLAATRAVDDEPVTTVFDEPADVHEESLPGGRHDETEPVRGVRILASAGSVRVIGDPLVARLAVDGPHTLRRSGDILTVECSPLLDVLSFEHGLGRFIGGSGMRRPRMAGGGRPVVVVRVNPSLPLDLEVNAGHAVVSGTSGALRAAVSAGSAVFKDITGPMEATVTAASLSVSGPLRRGHSRITCDMGTATVRLEPGASVRVKVRSNLGKATVDIPGAEQDDRSYVVGAGEAQLDIEGNLSSVSVSSD